MNGGVQISKNNSIVYTPLKRRSTTHYNNLKSKVSKLNAMDFDTAYVCQDNIIKNNDSCITESITASDSPFAESLNSNLCPIDDVLAFNIEYVPPIDLPKKFEYKVTEIYQIGFQVGDTERIYLPNVLDFQNVSYQYQSDIQLSEDTVNDIWNNMTPMILSADYLTECKGIQEQGMLQLENYLSTNLSTIISKSRLQEKQSMMSSYERITNLRRKMFQMISKIFSKMKFTSKFNSSTQDLDRFIDHLIIIQTSSLAKNQAEYIKLIQQIPDRDSLDPVVVLHRDMDFYFRELQQKCLRLIELLVPSLELPNDFNIRKDLDNLILRICSLN